MPVAPAPDPIRKFLPVSMVPPVIVKLALVDEFRPMNMLPFPVGDAGPASMLISALPATSRLAPSVAPRPTLKLFVVTLITALPVIEPDTLVAADVAVDAPIVNPVVCTVPPDTLMLEPAADPSPTVIELVSVAVPPVCIYVPEAVRIPTLRVDAPVIFESVPLIINVPGTPVGVVPMLELPRLIAPAWTLRNPPFVILTTPEALPLALLPQPIWATCVAFI